jgi:hypothetical protein
MDEDDITIKMTLLSSEQPTTVYTSCIELDKTISSLAGGQEYHQYCFKYSLKSCQQR